MAKTRVPPQAITKVNAERLLKKDLERNQARTAERKAKREAEKAAAAALKEQQDAEARARAEERKGQDAANALEAAKVDAAALGKPVHEVLADMGLDDQGFPLADPDAKQSKAKYDGPMIALKTARLQYVKAANGIECNGDRLALICGKHTRDVVVKGLSALMNEVFPGFGTPYAHLNPGQQSMNLRNKARGAIKNGLTSFEAIEAALNEAA